MARIEGEARRVIGFGLEEFYTFVHRTPIGRVSIQIPRVMVTGTPDSVRFAIEWEGNGNGMPPDPDD
ncbi:MAG: hypothetical protein QXU18_00265 [Thermoplasmatales archaeon]